MPNGLVAHLTGAQLRKLLSPIKKDVVAEIAAISNKEKVTSETQASPADNQWIQNKSTGVYHLRAPVTSDEVSSWTTACGWRYAVKSNGLIVQPRTSLVHKMICEKCLPEVRSSQKDRLYS